MSCENIILILLSYTQTMNYVAVNPNAFYNINFQNQWNNSEPSPMAMNPSQVNKVLQALSKALHSSLNNYEERYNQASQNIVKPQSLARNVPPCRENSPGVMKPSNDEEHHKENFKNRMEEEKEQVSI